jgi:hypothetical protein
MMLIARYIPFAACLVIFISHHFLYALISMKRRKTITKKKGGVSNSNNSNTNANKNTNTTGRTDFNRMLSNMSKNATFKGKEQPANKVLFATNSNYQASFGDIIAFEKGHAAQKAKLDTIIYHASNNDGLLSAYIAWRYLTKDLGKKDVALYGYKPRSFI